MKLKTTPIDCLRVMPTAFDFWVMLAILLNAFDKKIPWYLWVIIAAEAVAIFVVAQEVKKRGANQPS
jgi:hypothetical protein